MYWLAHSLESGVWIQSEENGHFILQVIRIAYNFPTYYAIGTSLLQKILMNFQQLIKLLHH